MRPDRRSAVGGGLSSAARGRNFAEAAPLPRGQRPARNWS